MKSIDKKDKQMHSVGTGRKKHTRKEFPLALVSFLYTVHNIPKCPDAVRASLLEKGHVCFNASENMEMRFTVTRIKFIKLQVNIVCNFPCRRKLAVNDLIDA